MALVLLAAAWFYYRFDPSESMFFPRCVFRTLTGLPCPGCGVQRALHSLFHGEFREAFRYNAGAVIVVPLLVVLVVAELGRTRWQRFYLAVNCSRVCWGVLALVLAWWALRLVFGL